MKLSPHARFGFLLFVATVVLFALFSIQDRRLAAHDAKFLNAVHAAAPQIPVAMPFHLEVHGREWRIWPEFAVHDPGFVFSVNCSSHQIALNLDAEPGPRTTLIEALSNAARCSDLSSADREGIDPYSIELAQILQHNPSLAAYLGGL